MMTGREAQESIARISQAQTLTSDAAVGCANACTFASLHQELVRMGLPFRETFRSRGEK
jgi:hypothetical protein